MRLSLKPLKPPTAVAAALRRFTADPHFTQQPSRSPESSYPVSEAISLLQKTDPISWRDNPKLSDLLSAVSPPSVLQITRRLPNSQNALQFLDFLRATPSLSDSAPFAFQAVLEIVMRENPKFAPELCKLFAMAKDRNIPLSVNAGTLLIKCFGRADMLEEMVAVFDAMDPQVKNTHVMNLVVNELLRAGRFDDALKLLDEMLQPNACYPPDRNTLTIAFSSILAGNSRGRRFTDEEIYDLCTRFGERGLCLGGYWLTRMISRFCKNGHCDKAWDVLHKAMSSGSEVEVFSCNVLLSQLGMQQEYARMNLLMKEMKDKGINPSVVTYGVLIKNLCRIRRLDEALEVLEKMINGEAGIEPDVVIYNSLIDGLCKVGRNEEGLKLLESMRLSESKCEPSTVTYNCLIDGFCKAGDIDKASELFEQMSNDGVKMNVVTLNTMVGGMCRHGMIGSAFDLFNSTREKKGLQGNVVTYTILITAFCGSNNIEKAMKLFEEMKENGCTPDAKTYYSLISGFTRAGRMDDAASFLSQMKEAGFALDIVGYNIMIGGFCKKNRMDEAAELLKDMEAVGVSPDRVTYNTLLSHFCDKGDFSHARKVLRNMKRDGLTPSVVTYGALIGGYCSKGSLAAAMKLFQDMKSAAKVPPNAVIYNILIDAHCQNDDVEGVIELMEEMKHREVKPNATTYNALFKGLYARSWHEKALEYMKQMNEEGCMPDYVTMEILTEWLSAVGETEKLKDFVQAYRSCDDSTSFKNLKNSVSNKKITPEQKES